eukprot:6372184-Amphidinium_carterae.2
MLQRDLFNHYVAYDQKQPARSLWKVHPFTPSLWIILFACHDRESLVFQALQLQQYIDGLGLILTPPKLRLSKKAGMAVRKLLLEGGFEKEADEAMERRQRHTCKILISAYHWGQSDYRRLFFVGELPNM